MAEPEIPQIPLFNAGEAWEEHWQGMPEFVQKNQRPFKTLFVHFESRAQMDAFAALVQQKINLETKYIWYPEAEIARGADKAYIDELLADSVEDDEIEFSD